MILLIHYPNIENLANFHEGNLVEMPVQYVEDMNYLVAPVFLIFAFQHP